MTLTASVLRNSADLRALEHEWRALEQRASCPVPFLTFDWATCWWSHLRENKLAVRDELYLHTIRNGAGTLVAVAPLMRTCRPGYGPLRARELQFFGADPNLTELRGMLAEPEYTEEAYATLLDSLQVASDDWDWLTFSGISDAGVLARLQEQLPSSRWVRDVPDFILPLPETWEAFKSSLPRNIKESLRKCYNAPKRDGHALSMEVIRGVDGVESGLEIFFRFHSNRAQVEHGVQHNDVFASQMAKRFLRDVCTRFAARDCLRIFVLKLDETPVAARVGFVMGDSLYLYYSGYDPTFAQYSVMTTAVAEAIQHAIKERFRTVNLSTGNDVSKTRWRPEEVIYRELFTVSDRARSKMTHHAYLEARKLLASATVHEVVGKYLSRRAD